MSVHISGASRGCTVKLQLVTPVGPEKRFYIATVICGQTNTLARLPPDLKRSSKMNYEQKWRAALGQDDEVDFLILTFGQLKINSLDGGRK